MKKDCGVPSLSRILILPRLRPEARAMAIGGDDFTSLGKLCRRWIARLLALQRISGGQGRKEYDLPFMTAGLTLLFPAPNPRLLAPP